MSEFTTKINRLMERLHLGTQQCDDIERRAYLAENRLFNLNESIQTLARIIDISYLMLISWDKEKVTWLKFINSDNVDLMNPMLENFFYRLEIYLRRPIINNDEKQAYIKALRLLQSPLNVSCGLLLNMKEDKKNE